MADLNRHVADRNSVTGPSHRGSVPNDHNCAGLPQACAYIRARTHAHPEGRTAMRARVNCAVCLGPPEARRSAQAQLSGGVVLNGSARHSANSSAKVIEFADDDVRLSVSRHSLSTPPPTSPPVVYHSGSVVGRKVPRSAESPRASLSQSPREPGSRDSQLRWLVAQESGLSDGFADDDDTTSASV